MPLKHWKIAGLYYTFTILTLLFSSHREESQAQLVCRSYRQETLALDQKEPVSPPAARVIDHIIDPVHLSSLHQSFLCTSQPVNQMSLPIEKSPYLSYDYSKLGFAYVTLLGFTEQCLTTMGFCCELHTENCPSCVLDVPGSSLVPVCRQA
ncbi:hypothetical protein DSO57_1034124 [Entomophthora muscae]|uniref:Uncharacterized protein n=1 Tax=Entomophthora muscae TaxID=34485 RepID=A0ACC2RQY1_9FUNG|nr:hypothetical protein DSO57_1034124 [Entomophthora muscae]